MSHMAADLLLSASLALAVDQLSKKIIMSRLVEGQFSLGNAYVRIRRVANARGGLRLIRNRSVLLIVWGVSALGILLLVRYSQFFQQQVAQVGLGAALGGATSNVCDQLRRGVIIDFIDVSFWPVFNLADVAIVAGIAVALWFIR
jgi:signal peptidase II